MTSYFGRRIVVLGAGGFLGTWLVRRLAAAGAHLTLPMRHPRDAPGEVIPLDLMFFDEVRRLLRSARPAQVFNLAGYGVAPEEQDEHLAWAMNADLPRVLCETLDGGIDPSWPGLRLIHAASCAEYGRASTEVAEDTPPLPDSLYGRTKLAGAEAVVSAASRGAVAVRIFNVYGPGEPTGRLTPSLLQAARSGTALQLSGCAQHRDFIYVEDVAEAFFRLGLRSRPEHAIANLATGLPISVREFVETAARVFGILPGQLQFGATESTATPRPYELDFRTVGVERLRAWLDWLPPTSVEQGLRRTLAIAGAA